MSSAHQEPAIRIFDNPLLIAQAQRQLRKKQLTMSLFITIAFATVVILTCLQLSKTSLTFSGSQQSSSVWLGGQSCLYFMILISLYWRGANALVHAVSEERKSGIFTFLRSTPLSPYSLTLGYTIGVNIRGYCVAGVLAPFWIGCSVAAGVDAPNAILSYLYILLGAFTLHSLVLAFALHTSGRTQRWGSSLFILGLWFLSAPFAAAGLHTLSHITPLPVLASLAGDAQVFNLRSSPVSLFGITLGSELYTLLVQGLIISISIWISSRRMERDDQAVMSRSGALLVMMIIGLFAIGCDLSPGQRSALISPQSLTFSVMMTQLLCLVLSCYIILISAPSRLGFIRAARRLRYSSKGGDVIIPWRSEGGSLLPLTFALIGVSVGLIALFLIIYGEDQTALSKMIVHVDMLTMIASSGLFVLFFSSVCEFIKSHAHQLNQSLAIFTVLVVFFLLPLILALIFKEPTLYVVSPVYTLVYGFCALGSMFTPMAQALYSKGIIDSSYNFISLAITVGVTIFAYLSSYRVRSKSLETQTVGDGD